MHKSFTAASESLGKLGWLEELLEKSESKIQEIIVDVYGTLSDVTIKFLVGKENKSKEIASVIKEKAIENWNHIASFYSHKLLLITICCIIGGVVLAYLLRGTFIWNSIVSSPLFLASKIAYVVIWGFIITKCVKAFRTSPQGYTSYFSSWNLEDYQDFIVAVLVGIFVATVLSYVIFVIFFAASKCWFLFFMFLSTGLCYCIFLINLKKEPLTDQRLFAFLLATAIFISIGYFFYGYVNKAAGAIRKAMLGLVLYLPVILTFVVIVVAIEYLQVEALKFIFFPAMKTTKYSLSWSTALFGPSTDFSKSFIFTLLVGWTYGIVTNLITTFVASLHSNRLIHGRMRLFSSLNVCYNNFGAICYASVFPGFLSSIKSALISLDAVVSQADLVAISYIVSYTIHCIISVLDGLDLFFGSYNQVSFAILAYETAAKDKLFSHLSIRFNREIINRIDEMSLCEIQAIKPEELSLIKSPATIKLSSTFDSRVFHQHPESLIFNSQRLLHRVIGTQPNSIFAYIFSKIDLEIHEDLKKYMFPSFLILQVFYELILLIGLSVVIQKHHDLVQEEEALRRQSNSLK